MKLFKTFPAPFRFSLVLLVACMIPWQALAIVRPRHNVPGIPRVRHRSHSARTIWERMYDPRGWWQSRLLKPNSPVAGARLRSSASPRSSTADTPANPIFFIPPTYGSGGTTARNIAVGDFNRDGKPDLLVSNQCVSDTDCTQGTVAVLLGNGDGTYQPAVVSNTGAVLASMTTGDFNRDGKLDVVVNNACPDPGCTTGSVNVLLGNGDGTFQPPVPYTVGGNAFSVEAGDLNGDGKLDLVVVNGSGSAGVLLGKGDGTFMPVSTVTTSTTGNSAVFLGDFNGDNKPDLAVVTGDCGSTGCNTLVSVLLGNGDGTFQAPTGNQLFPNLNPQAVALGDANANGKLDLAVVESCSPSTDTCVSEFVTVLLGKGDGTFNAAKNSALASDDVTFIGLADLSGDAKPDLITVDPDAASATMMLGNGDGTFHLLASYDTEGISPLFGALADLNGDGSPDLAVANACQSDSQPSCSGAVLAMLGNGSGSFQAPPNFPSQGGTSLASTAADFNADGKPDIALADGVSLVDVLLNGGNGTFQPAQGYGTGGVGPVAIAVGDFNGDGKPDIVVSNECGSSPDCTTGNLGLLLGNGDGTFQAAVTYPVSGNSPTALTVGDFNGDGKLDVAVVSQPDCCLDGSMGSVNILLGNGDGSFQPSVAYSTGDPDARSVTVADFNGDGKLDLAVANGNCTVPSPGDDPVCMTGSVGVLLGNGDGTFQPALRYSSVDDVAFTVVAGDFNGDGKPDLAVGNVNCADFSGRCGVPGSIAILLGKGDGTFATAVTYSPGDDPWPAQANVAAPSMAANDLNGDGKLDLVLSTRNILLGNGDGSFQAAQSYNPTGTSAISELVADFNGDGKPDLLVANSTAVALLLNISSGFQQATSTALSSSANPADFHRRVTFTATVTSTSQAAPTGTITFSDNGHALATVPLANGKATFCVSSLEAGIHPITASYSGNENFLPSTSPELDQVIKARTRTRLTSSHNPTHRGGSVTFTASVVANSGETPSGTITFKNFSTVLATAKLSGGQASFTTSRLRRGSHVICANFNGGPADYRSSAIFVQRVK